MSEVGQVFVGSIQAWGKQFVYNNLHINFQRATLVLKLNSHSEILL